MGRPNWQTMYNGLGAFSVVSVLTAVALNAFVVHSYREAVGTSRLWAERSADYGELSRLATLANGPGNDVFETHDVAGERAKLDQYVTQFEVACANAKAELAEDTTLPQRDALIGHLEACDARFREMVGAAKTIFTSMDAGDSRAAGAAMAQMDRSLAATSESLGTLAADVRALQSERFDAQTAYVDRLQWGAYGLVVLVIAMVAGVIAYGQELARMFGAAQAEIDRRRGEVALLLANVDQGLVTVGLDGRMSETRSAAFGQVFGAPVASGMFRDQLAAVDAQAAAWFDAGWEALNEGVLPTELVLSQLPRELVIEGRHTALRYRALTQGEALAGLLVVATDVTAERERERAETAQREALALFERVAKDRLAVVEFVAEADRIVRAVQSGCESATEEARLVHTLKGNAGIYGLNALVDAAHALEESFVDGGDDSARRHVVAVWDRVRETARRLIGHDHGRLEVADAELAAILQAVVDRRPYAEIATMINALKLEPLARRFDRLADQARSVAHRLGKGNIHVVIDDGGIRNDPDHTGAFWSALVHVVRNAVDHGIESPEARAAAGKTGLPTITLRAVAHDGAVAIEIADDGHGIDWTTLARKAGVIPGPGQPATDLLFIDGLSSRDEVSLVSGRGVGLGAARNEVQRLGGDVTVTSQPGVGTRFVFTIPADRLAPRQAMAG